VILVAYIMFYIRPIAVKLSHNPWCLLYNYGGIINLHLSISYSINTLFINHVADDFYSVCLLISVLLLLLISAVNVSVRPLVLFTVEY